VEIQNRALSAAEVATNFAAGVGERYYMLFDVSAQSGVPQSYIEMTASVYDSYSYLFTNPTFISLDANVAPANIPVKGMRIGVNGVIGLPGQSYSTLNATIGGSNYTAAAGQLLSSVGAVIPSDKGEATDQIFLSFDQLGSSTHVFTDTSPLMPPAPKDNPEAPDQGMRTFAEINATLSVITGVPTSDTAVNTQYNSLQQSLPPVPQIDAFVASQQTAISQLAATYCSELLANQQYRDAFFTNALDSSLTATSSLYFGSSGPTANRNTMISAITAHAVGTGVNASYSNAITTELNALLDKIPTVAPSTTVSAATAAACSAALGSAAVSLK
jgi:hypothetical protein